VERTCYEPLASTHPDTQGSAARPLFQPLRNALICRRDQDGVLVRRFVRQDVEQTRSLSPDGSGPTLSVTAHDSWWGLEDPLVIHGLGFRVSAPGTGVIAVIAGLDDIEGNHHGVLRFIEDPAAATAACDALT
jgi:hypothetical protein